MHFDIGEWIIRIPVLLFSITIHEYAHGRAALWLGDPTAKRMGRLSFNPLPHIDPFGAICLFLFNFGWAKPVPVNPSYFKNIRKGIIFMSFCGPLANILTALAAGILIRYFPFPWEVYRITLIYLLLMNLGLGLFNLLPLPPLDGSHILENILPPNAALEYRKIGRYGPIILLGIIMLDNFAHTGIIRYILLGPMLFLASLFSGINF
ncbi:MAG: site-2 protease family protein [Deltaproteobacteria bacterium]|nr:site-2 protease family protein [Deltaproteobacteria bacterium]HEN20559.1 site-2 protease family protein [Desulfobacteraceae bacterium]